MSLATVAAFVLGACGDDSSAPKNTSSPTGTTSASSGSPQAEGDEAPSSSSSTTSSSSGPSVLPADTAGVRPVAPIGKHLWTTKDQLAGWDNDTIVTYSGKTMTGRELTTGKVLWTNTIDASISRESGATGTPSGLIQIMQVTDAGNMSVRFISMRDGKPAGTPYTIVAEGYQPSHVSNAGGYWDGKNFRAGDGTPFPRRSFGPAWTAPIDKERWLVIGNETKQATVYDQSGKALRPSTHCAVPEVQFGNTTSPNGEWIAYSDLAVNTKTGEINCYVNQSMSMKPLSVDDEGNAYTQDGFATYRAPKDGVGLKKLPEGASMPLVTTSKVIGFVGKRQYSFYAAK